MGLLQRKFDQAEAHFQQILSRAPQKAEAEYRLATCYLVQGDFRRGWPAYEARLRILRLPPKPDLPRWNGEPLAGRRLILVGEQGLGDTLQFLRFARVLRSQGAHVTLAVQPPLARLLASHPDLDEVIVAGPETKYPAADFYLYLLSLPGLLGTNLSNIPAEVPYLAADPELSGRWRQELSKIAGFKIGIVWQATQDFPHTCCGRFPWPSLRHWLACPGVQLISLQKGAGLEQIGQVDFPVVDFGDRLDEAAGPFMDTAAIIANLDLVVGVDTSITHLAGALGAPVLSAATFLERMALAARPRRLALVSEPTFVPTTGVRPVARRFRAHRPGHPAAPFGAGLIGVRRAGAHVRATDQNGRSPVAHHLTSPRRSRKVSAGPFSRRIGLN